MVKTSHFHCSGYGFDHFSGNYYPTCCGARPKKKKKKLKAEQIAFPERLDVGFRGKRNVKGD